MKELLRRVSTSQGATLWLKNNMTIFQVVIPLTAQRAAVHQVDESSPQRIHDGGTMSAPEIRQENHFKKMMEASEENGDVAAASNTTEEEETPPEERRHDDVDLKETNSNSNHTSEVATDRSTKAAAAVAVETDKSQGNIHSPETKRGACGHRSQQQEPGQREAAASPQVEHQQIQGGRSLTQQPRSRLPDLTALSVPPQFTRQALAERMGRGSRTVDLDLEPRLELLRDDRQRYDHMTKLAQTLANQFAQFSITQKTMADAFTELSFKTKNLHVEFDMNAEAQKFLSKSTETLQSAISAFTSDMNTLVNKTIEDTMINAKQYEAARSVQRITPQSCRGRCRVETW
ncbi:hypothetical protein CCH79_00018612 [Gambusia affinis]|uniref:AH domain-containing protein n=1 Tax=Gambusia affinis TaxID=33528 RepID=A0A315VLL2_GAMAF|nr:hypothetical protein CCH79_00018612 [Gambusia affinis]